MNAITAMPDQETTKLLRDIDHKVTQIHTTIYGVEGQGGVMKVIEKHDQEIEGLKKSKRYAHGWAAGVAFLASTAWHFLTGGNK